MEVEESFDALFKDHDFENSDWMLSLVRKCISKSPVEREVLRAVEISLCFFIKKFDVEFLEEEVFQIACPTSKNIVCNKLNDIEKNPSTCAETFGVLLKILSYFREVFDFLNEIPRITIIEIKSLLIATSEILLSCFTHCKVSEKVYGSHFNSLTECLSNFFKKCCGLQDHLLHILTEKVECDLDDDREVVVLDQVMGLLSKLGIVLINLEVKTMAKVWKSFVVLTDRYLSVLKTNHNIGETIRNLCVSITTNMDGIFGKDEQDFSKIIKLNCFLLKLVIKFSEAFTEYLQDCQNSLLNLLLMLCRYNFFTTTKTDLMNQLTIGTNPLLSQMLADVKFIKECQLISKKFDKCPEFVVLCCLIVKKLQESFASTRSLWLTEKDNILDWIFLSASSSECLTCSNICLPSILVSGKQRKCTDLYEYVLVTTTAFLMTVTAEEFHIVEKTLIVNVVQQNPIRALFAIDSWCLMARFADSELCYSQILCLGKMFQDLKTPRTEKCNLGSLIRRLFPLLLDTHKDAFLKFFKPAFYCELWDGISANKLPPKEACEIHQVLLNSVTVVLDEDEVNFQKIAPTGHLGERLCRKISKLWGFNCELLSSSSQCLKFLKIVCILTTYVVSDLSSEDLLMVLSKIKKLLATEQPTGMKLPFIWILHSLSTIRIPGDSRQKQIIATIAEIFRDLLTSKQALVKEKAFETFYSFSHITQHGEVVSMSVQNAPRLKTEITDYFKRKPPDKVGFNFQNYICGLYRYKFVHVCQEVESPVLPKKIKLDSVKVPDLVFRWKENGKLIVEHFHTLSESQKKEVRNLCNSILSLPL